MSYDIFLCGTFAQQGTRYRSLRLLTPTEHAKLKAKGISQQSISYWHINPFRKIKFVAFVAP